MRRGSRFTIPIFHRSMITMKTALALMMAAVAVGCTDDGADGAGEDSVASALTSCGEASCVPAQAAYISHFDGANCTGAESYYLPYDGYAYACRTWNGTGECGITQRT